MLDSRYVHLHEALGLGAMWLYANAKVITQDDCLADFVSGSQNIAAVQKNDTVKTPSTAIGQNARLAILQRVRAYSGADNTHRSAIVNTSAQPKIQPENSVAPQVKVMVMSVCASLQDVAANRLFSGDDGILLWKMLEAIQLQAKDVFLTTWLKDLPDFKPHPSEEMVQAATLRVAQEWQQCGANYMLLLGDFFERKDVQAQLDTFSHQTQRFIIAHPMRILSYPQLKCNAWETLQQLQSKIQ